MREIKFRAWDKTKERLRNVIELTWTSSGCYVTLMGFDTYMLDEIELMQYTGLKDKNGVYIYEGDVLRDSESIVIVKFVDGEFSVDYRTMGGKWRNYGSLFDYLKDYEGEVIGNVYQNKDLLECEVE